MKPTAAARILSAAGVATAMLLLAANSYLSRFSAALFRPNVDLAILTFGPLAAAIVGGLSLDLGPRSRAFKVVSLLFLAGAMLSIGWSWDIADSTRATPWGAAYVLIMMEASLLPPLVLLMFRRVRSIGVLAAMALVLPYVGWWLRRN